MGGKAPSSSSKLALPDLNDKESSKHSEAVGGPGDWSDVSTPNTEDTDVNSQVQLPFSTPIATGTQPTPSNLASAFTPTDPKTKPRYNFRKSTLERSNARSRTNWLENSFNELRTKNDKWSKNIFSKSGNKSA